MEDKFWWNTTFDEEKSLMEDYLWWNMTFDGRHPLMGDNFDGRQLLLPWATIFFQLFSESNNKIKTMLIDFDTIKINLVFPENIWETLDNIEPEKVFFAGSVSDYGEVLAETKASLK